MEQVVLHENDGPVFLLEIKTYLRSASLKVPNGILLYDKIRGYKEQKNSWMINAVEIWGKSFLSPLKNQMANCLLHTAFPIICLHNTISTYTYECLISRIQKELLIL